MVLFSDNELRTILSNNSLLAWNDKDDTGDDVSRTEEANAAEVAIEIFILLLLFSGANREVLGGIEGQFASEHERLRRWRFGFSNAS